jgi:hypothetical protein
VDVSIPLSDGAELRLDATCRPCAAGWVHRVDVDRQLTVEEAVLMAGPRHVAVVVERTREVLVHLGACRDDAAQEPEHGEAVRLVERLEAAELRLGRELEAALRRLDRRVAA